METADFLIQQDAPGSSSPSGLPTSLALTTATGRWPRGARGQAQQHGLAGRGDAPGNEHRLGLGPGVVLEVRAVRQVLELDVGQGAVLEGVELVLDRLADTGDRRLRHRGIGPESLGQRRLDVAHRQAPDEPGDDQRLQGVGLVTPRPSSREANCSVTPRSFGRLSVTGPAVVFTVRSP